MIGRAYSRKKSSRDSFARTLTPLQNENADDDRQVDAKEEIEDDWDLRSPLLLTPSDSTFNLGDSTRRLGLEDRTPPRLSDTTSVSSSSRFDDEHYDRNGVGVTETFLTVSAACCVMLHAALVIGSWCSQFAWLDTVLRITTRTAAENGAKVDLPLYKDTNLKAFLAIFQDTFLIPNILKVSAVIMPAHWMFMAHPLLLWGVHRLSILRFRPDHYYRASSSASRPNTTANNSSCTEKRRVYFKNLVKCETLGRLLGVLEVGCKAGFGIFYVQTLLMVCTSSIMFAFGGDYSPSTNGGESNTAAGGDKFIYAQVVSETRGGLISYMLGTAFGISGVVLMRIHWVRNNRAITGPSGVEVGDEQKQGMDRQSAQRRDSDGSVKTSFSAPPSSAFQIPWMRYGLAGFQEGDVDSISTGDGEASDSLTSNTGSSSSPKAEEHNNDNSKDNGSEATLSEPEQKNSENNNEIINNNTSVTGTSDPITNLIVNECELATETPDKESSWLRRIVSPTRASSFWKILTLEAGILTSILLVPAFSLPLFRVDYQGLLAPTLNSVSIRNANDGLTMWGVIQSIPAGEGTGLFAYVAIAMFFLNVLIIPLVTWVSCLVAHYAFWGNETFQVPAKSTIFKFLRAVHPFSSSTPFAVSLLLTVASLEPVSDFLFNQHGFCKTLVKATGFFSVNDDAGEKCLLLSGTLLPGAWFLLLQGLCLDIFVRLTLWQFEH